VQWQDGQMRVWRLSGALFFGAVRLLDEISDNLPRDVLVIDFKSVIYLDASGADEVLELVNSCRKRSVHVILSGLIKQPLDIAQRTGFLELEGVEEVPDLKRALARAAEVLQTSAPALPLEAATDND